MKKLILILMFVLLSGLTIGCRSGFERVHSVNFTTSGSNRRRTSTWTIETYPS